MKTLTKLSGELVDRPDWTGPREVRAAMHLEVAPGRFTRVCLTPAGLVIKRGEASFGVPMAELLAAAGAAVPDLA